MKRIHNLCMIVVLSVLLISCGSNGRGVNLKEALNADGTYVFPGLAWGMTQAEVEEIAGYSLGLPVGSESSYLDADGKEHTNDMLQPDEYYVLHGNIGTVSYQFIDGGLISVYLSFIKNDSPEMRKNDPAGLYPVLADEVRALFGDPTSESEKERNEFVGRAVDISSCTWEGGDNTKLQISLLEGVDGYQSRSASFGFACLDFPRAVS